MISTTPTKISAAAIVLLLAFATACGNKQNASNEPAPATSSTPGTAPQTANAGQTATGTAPAPQPSLKTRAANQPGPITIPAGTVVTVRTSQALSSKTSQAGETFTATVAQPVNVGESVAIPDGAKATGTVVTAHALGRFKGGALLQLKLTSIEIGGQNVPVETSSVARSEKGKGKRSATLIGGGAGLGALIGGIAGGGKGAAIGALAGAGAGTAGTAFTGNKEIVIPAEYALSFKLTNPVEVKK